jgi:hypothetical protein
MFSNLSIARPDPRRFASMQQEDAYYRSHGLTLRRPALSGARLGGLRRILAALVPAGGMRHARHG